MDTDKKKPRARCDRGLGEVSKQSRFPLAITQTERKPHRRELRWKAARSLLPTLLDLQTGTSLHYACAELRRAATFFRTGDCRNSYGESLAGISDQRFWLGVDPTDDDYRFLGLAYSLRRAASDIREMFSEASDIAAALDKLSEHVCLLPWGEIYIDKSRYERIADELEILELLLKTTGRGAIALNPRTCAA